MKRTIHPYLLIILDGWGDAPPSAHNAISLAHTPYWDKLLKTQPHALLHASGEAVGLPTGQIGNSEVGHLHIGAGRKVPQDLSRIHKDIASGAYAKQPVLHHTLSALAKTQRAFHLLGLLSEGGIHSHETHLLQTLAVAAQYPTVPCLIHVILDGRDTPPQFAASSLARLQKQIRTLQHGTIASVMGRYYAMDRDQRWERTEAAYHVLTYQKIDTVRHASNVDSALKEAYARGETDEFIQPTLIGSPTPIQSGDRLFFTNFRNDRPRQLTQALISEAFTAFPRSKHPVLAEMLTMTSYQPDLPCTVLYPPLCLSETLGACVSHAGYEQLRIAETEKYAHVTFFFNGRHETPFVGEHRELIPSPKVATYDLKPAMHADLLTTRLMHAITTQRYPLIVCNYANPDMLGHTGHLSATIRAIETIEASLKRVIPHARTHGYHLIITADHGNAECMYDTIHQQPHTAHTTSLVPCVHVGQSVKHTGNITQTGTLADIAPTLLNLMGLPVPSVMDGQCLWEVSITT